MARLAKNAKFLHLTLFNEMPLCISKYEYFMTLTISIRVGWKSNKQISTAGCQSLQVLA